ncbi:TPA: hypothetical protein ACXDAY_004103 [Clostridium botulinum]|uniref:hypothetical protein n=2 Tax=Clostridium botulinum TaxID=1491 RepID=UPI00035BAEDF|nr:hypothetical protein [Clostridium botulinum]EPS56493.1 hypothetical protein CLQ_02206 [Clostridium botulinum Af84]MBN3351441.1 hypothetical protein [Clostridium botulinum]MBN3358719.1 hypothetical protein [Clostridium botulinum]MBN3389195.1 hypothetical protein [Clostridium botulinum]MBN3429720.1 hypothetical protein [Clostridium botulinum]
MFNFQMDNILSLHGLIGESKTEGITPLGKFKTKPYTSIPLEIVQTNIGSDKSNIAINNKGILMHQHSDNGVYWKSFGSSQLTKRHDVSDLDWDFDVCQLYPTIEGFVGIYKNNTSTKTLAWYTIIEYTDEGYLYKKHEVSIPQDATGSGGAYIHKVVQDPITKQFVFIFSSFATTATYLLVMDETLTSRIKSTFVEEKYSIVTKLREYMAYDGWLYGASASNSSNYCKMKYNSSEEVSKSFHNFYSSYANATVTDPEIGLMYCIVDGDVRNVNNGVVFADVPRLSSDGSEHLMCASMSPNPKNGFIIGSYRKRIFEVYFKVPKLTSSDSFPYPECRIITEFNFPRSYDNSKCFLSYDSKTCVIISYNQDRSGITGHTTQVYGR